MNSFSPTLPVCRKLFSGKNELVSGFPATVDILDSGRLRHWFSGIKITSGRVESYSLGRATEEADGTFRRENFQLSPRPVLRSRRPVIGNLPEGWMPVQPVRIALQGGGYRLWFWAHSPSAGVVRYLAADSDDDRVYNCVDPARPSLWHYCDRAASSRLPGVGGLAWNRDNCGKKPAAEPAGPPELVCNDATTIYQLPDGRLEIFSAAIRSVPKNSPEYLPNDNAAGYRRFIRRFVSDDRLNFIPAGTAIDFAEDDPPYLQFYYLAVRHRPDGTRDGILGRYDALAQTTDLEWCSSADGINWRRTGRPLFMRRPDELCVYASGNPLFTGEDGRTRLIYTAFNYTHNHSYRTGKRETSEIRWVELDNLREQS